MSVGLPRILRGAMACCLAAGLSACGTAYEDPQPWCTITALTGSTQCFYRTRAQCEATLSGLGGICILNPEYSLSERRGDKKQARPR
jgi:hypothetical protein